MNRNRFLHRTDPLPDTNLELDLIRTQRLALLARPYMPARSKYKAWADQLMAENITAIKYMKLKARLLKFHAQEAA